jgi:hypothetical protein
MVVTPQAKYFLASLQVVISLQYRLGPQLEGCMAVFMGLTLCACCLLCFLHSRGGVRFASGAVAVPHLGNTGVYQFSPLSENLVTIRIFLVDQKKYGNVG